jgi:hypothetical protein
MRSEANVSISIGKGAQRGGTSMKFKKPVLNFALFVAFSLLTSGAVSAQSTIFNIPSTDAVAKGKTSFEFDFISHLASHDDGGFQIYVPLLYIVVVPDRGNLWL